ncbi:putative GPI-anchored protein pfl2 [Xenopus laevis]|uniref:SEA domain-containing protein n=2 Tax=Xenopus laevis TaxID=8355 RepID=A0A974HTG5_XENLA|nr:putative GPI-anchored protein pfl2 [Xenopus laevis]OCT89478.1 hypothetical protein XELAEV_18018099mg [Xenopus laevis]
MWHPRSAFVLLLLLLLEMGWVELAIDTTTSAQSTDVSSSTATASSITTAGLITSFSTQSNNNTNTASNNATSTNGTATASPITQSSSTSLATPTVTSALITTPIPPVTLKLDFTITSRNFSQNLSDPNSGEYKDLKNNLENSLADIYKRKFTNFKSVNITEFKNGSIIVVSEVSFNSSQSPVAPTADNAVRVLASSIQQNGSIGGFQVDTSTIKSGSVSTSSLSALVVTVNFLIKRPYSDSLLQSLKNQTISWVESVLLNFLNAATLTTRAADPNVTFSNNTGWVQTNAQFSFNTLSVLDKTTEVIGKLLDARVNVSFSIVPSTLTVQGINQTFIVLQPPLAIMNVTQIGDLSNKTSDTFQDLSKRIEDSLKAIFSSQQLVEPVVNSFNMLNNLVIASVDLYFPSSSTMNLTTVVNEIVINKTEFINRNISLNISFTLPPAPTATTVAPVTSSVTTAPASTSTNGTSTNITSTPISTTAPTPSSDIALNVTFRITSQEFTANLSKSDSVEYKNLKGKVEQQLKAVYSTFKNFRNVTVTGFRNGSVIVDSNVAFDSKVQSSTDVTNDNLVRALVSSIASNGSFGDFKVDTNSIQSGSASVTNLSPENITVGFLIKIPYNASATDSLQNQITPWVNSSFLTLPGVTSVSLISNSVNFNNSGNWTQFNATYAVVTTNIFNPNQALDKVLEYRRNVTFYIVPSTLSIQRSSKSFNILSPTLGIRNVSYTNSLSDKTSDAFKNSATAIEGVLRDIFRSQQLVEPVVTSFRNDSRGLIVSVDLFFLSGITSRDVIQGIVNNANQFANKNIDLITNITDPTVPYSFTFKLLQDYTADLATNNMNVTLLNLITAALTSDPMNIISSSVSIRNNSGEATVDVQCRINDISKDNTAVQNALLQNQMFTDIVRISTLSVNGASNKLRGYAYKLRFTNLNFNANLTNPSSDDYKNMKIKIIRAMTSILSFTGAKQVGVLSFVSGSVIANTEVTVPDGGATFDQVTTAIVNNIDSLKSSGLTLDPQSVVTSTPSGAASTVEPPPTISAFPGYAVAIIVMCGLAILALPFLILFFVKTGLCSKVSKACSLKPPYGEYQGMIIPNTGAGHENYRTHSYEISN